MAAMNSAMRRENLRRWAISTKEKAMRLLAQTEDISLAVFSSSDNYIRFLDLISRLHHYDALNLLLIWNAYPDAMYLAGYKVWEKMLPPDVRVLKEEHKGKGIDLIAPFTDNSSSESSLVWYSVSVFDVTQTTVQKAPPPFDPAYVLDDEHIYFLMNAIRSVLSSRYDRSVVVQPPTQDMQELGLFGDIASNAVIVRDDLPPDELLQWLAEALAQVSIADQPFASPALQLLRDSIRYCLFRIWGLEAYVRAPGSSIQLKAAAPRGVPFLHILRDTVRELNNMVCCFYTAERQNSDAFHDDLDEDSPEALFSIPG